MTANVLPWMNPAMETLLMFSTQAHVSVEKKQTKNNNNNKKTACSISVKSIKVWCVVFTFLFVLSGCREACCV